MTTHPHSMALDSADRLTLSAAHADAKDNRRLLARWAFGFCLASAVSAGFAVDRSGGIAVRLGWIAGCLGLLAGFCALAAYGARPWRLLAELEANSKDIHSGVATNKRLGGHRNSMHLLEVDRKTYTVQPKQFYAVEQGDDCEVHLGVLGTVLQVRVAPRQVDGPE